MKISVQAARSITRSVLRHIRVAPKQELKERIMLGIKYVNRHPVVHTWSYKLIEAAQYDSNQGNADLDLEIDFGGPFAASPCGPAHACEQGLAGNMMSSMAREDLERRL